MCDCYIENSSSVSQRSEHLTPFQNEPFNICRSVFVSAKPQKLREEDATEEIYGLRDQKRS